VSLVFSFFFFFQIILNTLATITSSLVLQKGVRKIIQRTSLCQQASSNKIDRSLPTQLAISLTSVAVLIGKTKYTRTHSHSFRQSDREKRFKRGGVCFLVPNFIPTSATIMHTLTRSPQAREFDPTELELLLLLSNAKRLEKRTQIRLNNESKIIILNHKI
jgi:hypothetical protein